MIQQVTYVGQPFYLGQYDKEIFQGHLFNVRSHPVTTDAQNRRVCDCQLSPHIHVQSVTYPQVLTTLFEGEYLTRY